MCWSPGWLPAQLEEEEEKGGEWDEAEKQELEERLEVTIDRVGDPLRKGKMGVESYKR